LILVEASNPQITVFGPAVELSVMENTSNHLE